VSYLDYLNYIAKVYAPLWGVVVVLIGGIWGVRVSRNGRISKEDRAIFDSVYTKITEAISLVFKNAAVDEEAQALFWQARDQARRDLPNKIKKYTQRLFDKMNNCVTLNLKLCGREPLPVGEKDNQYVDKHDKLINDLINEQPYKIFSKYMKIQKS